MTRTFDSNLSLLRRAKGAAGVACFALSVIGMGSVPQAAFADTLPAKAAPATMREVATGGKGRILTAHIDGTASARKMLLALKRLSSHYFEQPLIVTRAYADPDDKHLQASFTARLKGVPVHGIASVAVAGGGGTGTLLFDNAQTFSDSFSTLASLSSRVGKGSGGAATKPVSLTRQNAPDGSCQISLPSGFHITAAYKGTLDIVGPKGAQMGLGAPIVCTSRQAASYFPGIPPVDFSDPAQALVDYVTYSVAKAGKTVHVRVLDVKPVPNWQTGRAAFVRYAMDMDGRTDQAFGLFAIAQTDVNQAMLYSSYIEAPAATYRQQFPGMLQAWGTWSINPSVFTERLMAAAQTMRGMDGIILSRNANQEKTNDRVNEAWSDVFRDQGTWENPTTGDRYKLPDTFTNLGTPTQDGVALQAVPLGDL